MGYRAFMAFVAAILLVAPLMPAAGDDGATKKIIGEITPGAVEYYLSNLERFGVRYTGSEECRRAEEWVYEKFESMGLDVEYHEWKMSGFEDRNIVATLKGEDNYTIIIGAHIDAVPTSPGADDDGSGVAVVMTIARILSHYHFLHTLKFIIYTGEEEGTYGSYSYAMDAYAKGEKIIGVYNLDMVGYAETEKGGKYIRIFETERGKNLTDLVINTAEKYHDLIGLNVERVPNYPGSDHEAYIDYGYDAIFIAHYDSYPYGHSPEDSIDKINFTYAAKVAKLFAAVMAEMGDKQIKTYVEIKEPKEGYLYIFSRPIIPIIVRTWYLGMRGITVIIGHVNVVAEVDGDVDKVIFAMDDRMWKWVYSPPYEWTVNSFAFGKHYIKVYAYGDEVARDEMDILAFIPYIP